MTVTIFLLQVVQDFWLRTRIVPQPDGMNMVVSSFAPIMVHYC